MHVGYCSQSFFFCCLKYVLYKITFSGLMGKKIHGIGLRLGGESRGEDDIH